MDNKELVAGTSLFIPIWVEGALIEVGDGHDAEAPTTMPLTTTLIGDLFADDKILSVAHAYQAVTDWHLRRPPLG